MANFLIAFIGFTLAYLWGRMVGYKEGRLIGQLVSSLQLQEFLKSLPGDERMLLTNLMRAHLKTLDGSNHAQTSGRNT